VNETSGATRRRETAAAEAAVVVRSALFVLLVLTFAAILVACLLYAAEMGGFGRSAGLGNGRPPESQHSATMDRRSLERSQRERLRSYGWVDRREGVAHVPIKVAMEELASRGQVLRIPPSMRSGR